MFILMTQASSGDPVVEDVKNIREFYPDEVQGDDGGFISGTVVNLYQGSPWFVREAVHALYEELNKNS